MSTINEFDTYTTKLPPINGILWQMLLNNVPLRRPWDTLGVGRTLIQWIAVDGYAFVDNPWLPSYNITLDVEDLASYPFATEIIMGTAGYFSEVTSRANIPLMADLAQKFASMDWPSNVKGFYFPVEIDPTWTDAPEVLGPVWATLPRPLYISAYYGAGIDGAEAAQWLYDLLPKDPDVHLMFQDGTGAFGFTQELALERLGQLDALFGKDRVEMIAEAFKVNPDWDGTPGEFFLPLTEAEYITKMDGYREIYNEGRLWAFDGPNYIKNDLIDALNNRPSLSVPTGLTATLDNLDNVRLYSTVVPGDVNHTRKYTVYDTSGNVVLRTYYANSTQPYAVYPRSDYLEDFGFPPTFIVFDVQSERNRRYVSDRSELYVGSVGVDPSVSNAKIAKSNWWDIAVKVTVEQPDPSLYNYFMDIYHPVNTSTVMRTVSKDGATHAAGVVRLDYPVELNVPDYVAAFSFQGSFDFLKYRIRAVRKSDSVETLVGNYEDIVAEDNSLFVKKTAIMGINSLIGGYFNDLSDPLNPGGTGNLGRKDVTAAHTFRETLASNLGLAGLEVMPVMTVVGSSPINPMPYQAGFDLNNYWWDGVNHQPGPNLLYADPIVRNLDVAPDWFVISGPGETTGIAYADPSLRAGILTAWRQSCIEMLAWMRANWGNPSLEIWFQGASTSWYGTDIPPTEVNAVGADLLRTLQTSMSLEGIGFKMGSYIPDGNLYTTYRNEMAEGIGWVHYTVAGYHAAAAEMGQAMALNINRALSPPAWTLLKPCTNLAAIKEVDNDIRYQWTARPGATNWYYKNKRADNNAILSEGPLASAQYTFTAAAQVAAYGFSGVGFVTYEVAEYDAGTSTVGPLVLYSGSTVPE